MEPTSDVQNTFAIFMGLNILLGLVLCFSGYFISKARLALGALLGYILAANLGFSMFQNQWGALGIGLVGAGVGALVSTVFYFLGLFLIGALLGNFIATSLYTAITRLPPQPLMVFISAVAGGILVLLFRKLQMFIMIGASALAGSALAVFGILYFTTGNISGTPSHVFSGGGFGGYLLFGSWLALAIAGITVQYKWLPDPKERGVMKPEVNPAPPDIPPGG